MLYFSEKDALVKRNTQMQQLVYVAEYSIWSKRDAANAKYNKLICVLENALNCSKLSIVDTSDRSVIKLKGNKNENVYRWFESKTSFSTTLNCELFSYPRKEESKVVEHLVASIEAAGKQDTSYFTAVRNKVISLISFAIKKCEC